ncbi:Cytochrome P450 [Thermomonospora echinospora]|uniref:Cytochrome P450 n=1 Tax=Thermomonospora echinospora TaxID=1992 RepID=A0A1H6DFD1_9ACTN|nr:cytochrome P450 [Thermomonospora echinospora]SEG83931.1 Cytochrome P450 [Thermomonospora echinospora]
MEKTPPTSVSMPDEWCLRHFDHLSAELAATMPETMARMRELCPVARSEEHGGFWVVTRYEDALHVAQNWQVFSSAHGLNITRAPMRIRNLPVQADPPEQRIFKRLINPFFTPAAVAPWERPIRDLVNRLIDGFVEDGSCEFMAAFARPLPSLAFFELAINAPAEDLAKVAHLASRSATPDAPDAGECWRGLHEWVRDFTRRRRTEPPRGDVVDAVVRAEIDGRPITEEEIVGTVQLLILGGLETTAGALGLMVDRFCAQPEIPALLRARPELIPAAVQELLRLDSSFVAVGRTAVRDAVLGGHRIRAGDKVLIHWASANRDPGEFADADAFDPARERNRHLGFGVGPHRCAGSNLARLNLRVALEELLRRLADIRLAEGATVGYHRGLTRSPDALPITFTPGPRLAPAAS